MKIRVVSPDPIRGLSSTHEVELDDVKTLSDSTLSEALFYAEMQRDDDSVNRLRILRREQLRRWLVAEEDEKVSKMLMDIAYDALSSYFESTGLKTKYIELMENLPDGMFAEINVTLDTEIYREHHEDYPDPDDEWGQRVERFADPGGNSALYAAGPDNPRDQPCPGCGVENVLTPRDVAAHYVCNVCADRAEHGLD